MSVEADPELARLCLHVIATYIAWVCVDCVRTSMTSTLSGCDHACQSRTERSSTSASQGQIHGQKTPYAVAEDSSHTPILPVMTLTLESWLLVRAKVGSL